MTKRTRNDSLRVRAMSQASDEFTPLEERWTDLYLGPGVIDGYNEFEPRRGENHCD